MEKRVTSLKKKIKKNLQGEVKYLKSVIEQLLAVEIIILAKLNCSVI